MSLAFSRKHRLINKSDYKHVFSASECQSSDRYFTVLGRCSLSEMHSRLGMVVAKKKILRAHERNRIKRLVRESFRHYSWQRLFDVVVLAKHAAQFADNSTLFMALEKHWQRIER